MDLLRSIVVPTDFSALSEIALERAVALAKADDATLHLVHAARYPILAMSSAPAPPTGLLDQLRHETAEHMERAQKQLEALGVRCTTRTTWSADPAEAITQCADEHLADLIAMGTHGRGGIQHAFIGSVTERTLRAANCPVMAVKDDTDSGGPPWPIERILLATDFSVHANCATDLAGDLAAKFGAHVDVVHALELPSAYVPYAVTISQDLDLKIRAAASVEVDRVEQMLAARAASVTSHLIRGRASEVISARAQAERSQLIVMGTRGNSGLSHVFLGSVAERTIRLAPCAVMAVRAADPEAEQPPQSTC